MSKSMMRTKYAMRLAVFGLSLIILVGTLPGGLFTVHAETQTYENVFTVTVKDQDNNPIEEASITGTFGDAQVSEATTDSNGEAALQGVTDSMSSTQQELILSVTATGFHSIADESYGNFDTNDVSDIYANVNVEMLESIAPGISNITGNPTAWVNTAQEISFHVTDMGSGVSVNEVSLTPPTHSDAEISEPAEIANGYSFSFDADINGDYKVKAEDENGNEATETITVSHIDCDNPDATAPTANPTAWTKGNLTISGTVSDALSGVKEVWYQKGAEGDAEKVDSYTAGEESYSFTVLPDSYDGNYVVYCVDNAGNNSPDKSVAVKQDNVPPTVSAISADPATWTNGSVTISGTVSDNSSGVNEVWYKKGVAGPAVKISDFVFGTTDYTFTLESDNYQGPYYVYCVDVAGNQSDNVPAYVKQDTIAPEYAKIEVASFEPWETFWSSIAFKFFAKNPRQVTVTAKDSLSDVKSIGYYTDNSGTDYDYTQAAALSFTPYATPFSVSFNGLQNKKVVIYARITDNAGNISYFRTNGMVFDNIKPAGDTTLPAPIIDITLPNSNVVGLHKSDIPFRVQVHDPDTSGLASGLRSITTTVSAPHREDKVITATAVAPGLESQDAVFDSDNITGKFDNNGAYVAEKSFDSNYVTIKVVAVDKAGNEYTKTVSTAVDITAPTIDVSYDNNTFSNGAYLGNNLNRKATIDITELNFKNANVKIDITKDDESLNVAPAFKAIPGAVDENGDQTGWRMVIDFAKFGDGDYTFDISVVDKVGSKNTSVNYGDSINPRAFTIDNTKPTIAVSYDNNSALNDNYYNADRTATIVITEHNFEADMVNIIGTATDDGSAITFPALSAWTSSGDVRTARINYSTDAYYTFGVEYTDSAGNIAASYTPENFYVDKTAPVLANEQDDKTADIYVAEEKAKILEYHDKNFHEIQHDFSAYNFNIKDRDKKFYEMTTVGSDPSAITDSSVNISEDAFGKDGVYEIKSTAFDYAGNDSGEKVYTYVVMRNTAMMAYIPEESLVKFDNTGTRAIEFEDIPINVYSANDSAFTLKIGETTLDPLDYSVLGVSEIANQVKEHRLVVTQSYITSTFNEDNQVYDLPINISNQDGQIITIGRMVIDNVKPFGEFESGFENGKGYYNVNEKQVQVSKLSDDIDEEATTVNVDGSNVDFTYAPDTKTISFTLNKSNAYGHPWSGHKIRATLVDTAGNEYSLAEVSNIYIGNWFLRFWIIFIVGAAVVIGAGACIMLMRRRKVVD